MRRNTMDSFGGMWIEQGFGNMLEVGKRPPVTQLRRAFYRKPAVIVAPGPSLRKNVHLLPGLKGRAVIITFTHTLHALQAAGVAPDVVLALDPEDLRYHFDGIDVSQMTLVVAGTVHPEVYKLPVKRIFTFAGNSVMDDWMFQCLGGDTPSLLSGGSVAHSALGLGVLMRCDPIVFVGQDLAFSEDRYYVETCVDGGTTIEATEDGKFVTRGYSDGFRRMESIAGSETTRPEGFEEVAGYYGGTVRTSTVFKQFLRWFIHAAECMKGRVRLVNATEGGAELTGMEHLPLAEVAAEMVEPLDVDGILEAHAGWPEAKTEAMLAKRREIVDAVPAVLDQVKLCRALSEVVTPGTLGDLEAEERKLVSALGAVLFTSIMEQEAARTAKVKARRAQTFEGTLQATRDLYGAIERAVARVEELAA